MTRKPSKSSRKSKTATESTGLAHLLQRLGIKTRPSRRAETWVASKRAAPTAWMQVGSTNLRFRLRRTRHLIFDDSIKKTDRWGYRFPYRVTYHVTIQVQCNKKTIMHF